MIVQPAGGAAFADAFAEIGAADLAVEALADTLRAGERLTVEAAHDPSPARVRLELDAHPA